MKIKILIVSSLFPFLTLIAQENTFKKESEHSGYGLIEKYNRLPFGSIKPAGWIKIQMEKDMTGFVGNLDKLVPELINDPIYGSSRLHKQSKAKDLGNLKSGDAEGEEQYKWWNSETQSNWWDGYIRNAFLLKDTYAVDRVNTHIAYILATQDTDGYLGIYDQELRYKFKLENGELWSKTTRYRGLLAYYEYSHNKNVWNALVRAVDNVMKNYPINNSQPFFCGNGFSGGVAHGLTFTDILDHMYQITGERKYLDYAVFLYKNFSENNSSEKDAQLKNILDPDYKLQSHGVHTYEHLRPLIVATYASGNKELRKALDIYLARIRKETTFTGGPVGDEWIEKRKADATSTGYEYCSIQELMDSYTVLFQKEGNPEIADQIENIFYNAAQGSRNPAHSCIAYLKTDNSYEMTGTKNGEAEPKRNQTRYKYSPAHQDVAVCCNPNAGRITPYFIQSMWLKENENILVASLLGPSVLETTIMKVPVKIEELTEYPFKNSFTFKISSDKEIPLKIKIRRPNWIKTIQSSEKYEIQNGFIVIQRTFKKVDSINLKFSTTVMVHEDSNHEKYFTYGALVFAKPISAVELKGRTYLPGFYDLNYLAKDSTRYDYIENNKARYRDNIIYVNLKNSKIKKTELVKLEPFCKTILRQTSFR